MDVNYVSAKINKGALISNVLGEMIRGFGYSVMIFFIFFGDILSGRIYEH